MRSLGKTVKKFGNDLSASLSFALDGIVHTLRTERNMRIHFLAGFAVLVGGIYVNLSPLEYMALSVTVCFVLVTEMFNTAVEHMVDMVESKQSPLAKVVKDIAAGAVFVAAVNAAVVGYLIVFQQIDWAGGPELADRLRQSPWHLTLIALIVVVGLVFAVKVIRNEKSLLRGGMPSGHASVSFSIWVVVSFVTADPLVSILVFFLAVLVARSRVTTGIHSVWETLAGALLGALVTLFVFQMIG
jgi:diacylglycerol kinase (ATP)